MHVLRWILVHETTFAARLRNRSILSMRLNIIGVLLYIYTHTHTHTHTHTSVRGNFRWLKISPMAHEEGSSGWTDPSMTDRGTACGAVRKFSPTTPTGEIGEIFLLAKIYAYTNVNCSWCDGIKPHPLSHYNISCGVINHTYCHYRGRCNIRCSLSICIFVNLHFEHSCKLAFWRLCMKGLPPIIFRRMERIDLLRKRAAKVVSCTSIHLRTCMALAILYRDNQKVNHGYLITTEKVNCKEANCKFA